MQTKLPGMRNALSRADIDGVPPETHATLATNIQKAERIEALALKALSGPSDPDHRTERLIEFYEIVGKLGRDELAGKN